VIEVVEEKGAKAKKELGPERHEEIISMMITCAQRVVDARVIDFQGWVPIDVAKPPAKDGSGGFGIVNVAMIPSSPMPLVGRVVDHVDVEKTLTNNIDGPLKGKKYGEEL
jgi:hypothetical protein